MHARAVLPVVLPCCVCCGHLLLAAMLQLKVDKSLKDSVVAAWRFSYNESTWNETSVYSSNPVRKTKLLPVVISGGPACHPDAVSKPPKGPPWGHFHGSGHHDGTPHRGSLHAHSQLHHAVTDTSLVLTATHPSGFSSCIVAFLWSFVSVAACAGAPRAKNCLANQSRSAQCEAN